MVLKMFNLRSDFKMKSENYDFLIVAQIIDNILLPGE